MPTGTGIRGTIREVADRASAVMRLQAELFRTELSNSGKNAAAGAGIALGAAFIGVFAFGLLTALFVVALAIVLPLWLSILIVLVVYVFVAAVLVAVARNRFQQAKGAPLAREEARRTAAALGVKTQSAPDPVPAQTGSAAGVAGPPPSPPGGGGDAAGA